jgi:hypothetical protein
MYSFQLQHSFDKVAAKLITQMAVVAGAQDENISLVATPLAAAVRMAVMDVASRMARSILSASEMTSMHSLIGSNWVISLWMATNTFTVCLAFFTK